VSISSTFYGKLLQALVPKVQKDTNDLTVFFVHLGSALVKAAHITLMKLTSGTGQGSPSGLPGSARQMASTHLQFYESSGMKKSWLI